MSATALFPMYFLKSFAYAGVATVAFVATASIVITPAAIVLLGPRLDALDVRRWCVGCWAGPIRCTNRSSNCSGTGRASS